ncbi:HTH domain-containing protein [Halobacteriaceae archaeon SHR40]|uniref:HTH domain-containing protein n=1 Tax=Halovenus amylolytica TaxID=2500550 RepID=UPI000FE34000
MLSESDLTVLSYLSTQADEGFIQRELADGLDWDPGHTSRVVSNLAENELVTREQQNGRYRVSLSNAEPTERFTDLTREFPHVDFPNLLAGSTIQLLYYLGTERTAAELIEWTGVSRATVYRRLKQLRNVGIATKHDSRFALTSQFRELATFARSLVHHMHRQEASGHATGVRLIWTDVAEYLFSCRTDVTASLFQQTGPGALDQYGIELLTREEQYYFRSEERTELTPDHLVCHLLLIDDGARYRSYCLLLIAACEIETDVLTRTAERYDREAEFDLSGIVQKLCAYLDSDGAVSGAKLPEWDTFKSTAADYHISV